MITFFWPWLLLLLPLPLLSKKLFGFLLENVLENVSENRLQENAEKYTITEALKLPDYNELLAISEKKQTVSIWHNRLIIPWMIWSLLVISVSQPLWIDDKQPIPVTGRDLMLLIDVSGSMRKMDFVRLNKKADPNREPAKLSSQNVEPLKNPGISRLDVVKEAAARFVRQRSGDRTGLILFGKKPYLRAALSYDRNAVEQLIMESEIALAGETTAIGDAIGLAIKRLRDLPAKSRVIVLLTDGANNEGLVNPRKAAQLAYEQGIRIYTIGIGKQTIPGPNPYGIWSAENAQRYEKTVLKELAQITGGHFFHALDSEGLQAAYDRLNKLEPTLTQNVHKYLAYALYPWSLACAVLLSIFGLFSNRLQQSELYAHG